MTALEASFAAVLTLSGAGEGTAVRKLANRSDVFVGRGTGGRPVVYVRTAPSSQPYHPILLAHLSVAFDIECDLIREDGQRELGRFARIEGMGEDEDARRMLFQAIEPSILALPNPVRALDIEVTIKRLTEVFRLLDGSARTTALGLWGEMLLLTLAPSEFRSAAIAAWHTDPLWLQDFGLGDARVEVKTTSQDRRTHEFRLRQLTEGASEIVVVSLMTKSAPQGRSIEGLWTGLRADCGTDETLIQHLDSIVASSLGSSLGQSLGMAYDAAAAVASRRVYLAEHVPQPGPSMPSEVTDVRFTVDLGLVPESEIGSNANLTLILGLR